MLFDLTQDLRLKIFQHTIERLDDYYQNTNSRKVSPKLDVDEILSTIKKETFTVKKTPNEAVNHVIDALEKYSVHTPHPDYFGLFNPRANFSGILADLITSVYNPQLAAWSHAPFAVEVENHLVQELGKKFGLKKGEIDGVFTTGGAEANLTAILCALNETFPDFANEGFIGQTQKPIIYCSKESHHSVVKAARTVGLGKYAVRTISVNNHLQMDPKQLIDKINEDQHKGNHPFLLIATAGTTGTGAIDNLFELQKTAKNYDLWFHVDAAYGGAAILSPNSRHMLNGIEHADSITFDAHKWMSVPMGTSIFLTSSKEILAKTFRVTTEYMPKEANELEIVDPFTHSIQWSRRFAGLKLYLSLIIFGWEGYEEVIEHQLKMGHLLRELLSENGWEIMNDSFLPIICFTDKELRKDSQFVKWICSKVIESGEAWISSYPINGSNTIRACITNYATEEYHIRNLVQLLGQKRKEFVHKEI
ncbi:MAG: aminotransferase class V-fold PLP-dependent enzyme [Bacteroidota bacterium]